jgi:hypothetical protein
MAAITNGRSFACAFNVPTDVLTGMSSRAAFIYHRTISPSRPGPQWQSRLLVMKADLDRLVLMFAAMAGSTFLVGGRSTGVVRPLSSGNVRAHRRTLGMLSKILSDWRSTINWLRFAGTCVQRK